MDKVLEAPPKDSLVKQEQQSFYEQEKVRVLREILQKNLEFLKEADIPLQSPPEQVLEKAVRFVEFFDIDEDFFLSRWGKIHEFLFIALVDEWIQKTSTEERKGISILVRILTSRKWITNIEKPQLSKRVAQEAQQGYRMGKEYAPTTGSTAIEQYWKEKVSYAEQHPYVEKAIKENNEEQQSSSSTSKKIENTLEKLRARFVNGQERPFQIQVIDISTEEMRKKFHGTLAFYSGGCLYLPKDWDEHLVEHEYIHSQQPSFCFGADTVLGRALVEALTEKQTQHPIAYTEEQEVLSLIEEHDPDLFKTIQAFHHTMGVQDLSAIYERILAHFGLQGLLATVRCSFEYLCTESNGPYYYGPDVFLEPIFVRTILRSTVLKIQKSV